MGESSSATSVPETREEMYVNHCVEVETIPSCDDTLVEVGGFAHQIAEWGEKEGGFGWGSVRRIDVVDGGDDFWFVHRGISLR